MSPSILDTIYSSKIISSITVNGVKIPPSSAVHFTCDLSVPLSTLNNETPSMASTTSPSATVTSTSSSNGSTSTSSMRSGSSSTGSGSSSSSGGSQTSAGQGTREKPPLSDPKDVSGMPQARPSRFPTLPLPPPSSEDRERDAFVSQKGVVPFVAGVNAVGQYKMIVLRREKMRP